MAGTFQSLMGKHAVVVDARAHIGPHHLAIGKTRKLFEWRGVIHAFFSDGYGVRHARADADTLAIRDVRAIAHLPIGWGGGSFCIDQDAAGAVTLVFLHRNKHEFAMLRGNLVDGNIVWQGWRTLSHASSRLAAPWVEVDRGGNAWCSVLSRNGEFQVGFIGADGAVKMGSLFNTGEKPWYHSCVQVLPIGADRALAVGFRGDFPAQTELVFRSVSSALELGPSQTLAPCNVNDALTFHFQAVGDPARGRAHIVYLDQGLSTSHAVFENNSWRVYKNVVPFASFAPQIGLNEEGALAFLAVDYDGLVWSAAWDATSGWSAPRRVENMPLVNVSSAFARTGYGTGGLISAARSDSGRLPFLMGVIDDDASAHASLYLSSMGRGGGLLLAKTPAVRIDGNTIHASLFPQALCKQDAGNFERCWVLTIPNSQGGSLKLCVNAGAKGLRVSPLWCDRFGARVPDSGKAEVIFRSHDAFSASESAAIEIVAQSARSLASLLPKEAWVETYAGHWSAENCDAELIDVAPFAYEPGAATARNPTEIPRLFKRIL